MDWLARLPEPTLTEQGWRAWTDFGVEVETAEFLFGLVRLLRPRLVVESGTGEGFAAVALASGLQANGQGKLVTFEPVEQFRLVAEDRLAGFPAQVRPGYSCDTAWSDLPDVVFLDSYGTERPREIAYWADKPVTLAIHDAREHAAHLPEGGCFFPTPRGLWLRSLS